MFSITSDQLVYAIATILGFLIVILLAANGFFIRKFFTKIETMDGRINEFIPTQKQKTINLERDVEAIKGDLQNLNRKFDDSNSLSGRVGVLEYALKINRGRNDKAPNSKRKL